MKNKHSKLALARKMLTPEEIRRGVTPFNSAAWQKRKLAKHLAEKNKRK